ncbi:MAG: DPP IV N-terminal domain-containing protein [Planctomycetes bacterium]|nr:DPP IV N-terminal domain-containing protein [Planctomycetota bacterium]
MSPAAWVRKMNASFWVFLLATTGVSAGVFAQSRPASEPATSSAPAEKKRLTPGIVYDREGGYDFSGSHASGMNWIDDASFSHHRDGKLMRVDALSDQGQPMLDAEAIKAALLASGQFNEETAERLKNAPGSWTRDRSAALIRHEKKAYVYRVADKTVTRVTEIPDDWKEIALSPSGTRLSYVKNNDLYLVDTSSRSTRRLTRDGSETILNGVLDWVYQEEIYGRGNWRAYWWRDDDRYFGHFRLDESPVPIYEVIDPIPYRQSPERWRYPKAGDPNPLIKLAVSRARDGRTVWVDLSKYQDIEFLISHICWAPDGKLIFYIQDREQRWMDVNEADPDSGRSVTLFHEQNEAYVENTESPHWLGGYGFVWLSDRDGYNHAYFYSRDGKLIRRLTEGPWEIRNLAAIDELGGWVYFTAEIETPFQAHLYRVPFSGGPPQRLTELGYNHDVRVSPHGAYFFDTHSNAMTPPRVTLRRGDGSLVRVVSENPQKTLEEFAIGRPEFVRVPARDGFLLNAVVIRPPDFDPAHKYPVWCPIYAGPHSPTLQDSWAGGSLGDQLMATEGTIVWKCDPRSASGNSSKETWHCYENLGPRELADIEDGLKWLIAQGGVDEGRIGIEGHSYGGYMTCYALTHSTMFRCGIAGAPVTDWRNYDSIYTERYMRLPKNNTEGYDRGSAVTAAENLHGRLLIAHGVMDENVHMANTAQFIRELQKHRKQFDLMLYPTDRHGFGNGARHWRDLRREFMQRNL